VKELLAFAFMLVCLLVLLIVMAWKYISEEVKEDD